MLLQVPEMSTSACLITHLQTQQQNHLVIIQLQMVTLLLLMGICGNTCIMLNQHVAFDCFSINLYTSTHEDKRSMLHLSYAVSGAGPLCHHMISSVFLFHIGLLRQQKFQSSLQLILTLYTSIKSIDSPKISRGRYTHRYGNSEKERERERERQVSICIFSVDCFHNLLSEGRLFQVRTSLILLFLPI